MRNRILVACVGIPLILVALFALPAIFTPILIGVLSVAGTYEALRVVNMDHPRVALYTMLLALAVPFWVYFGQARHWALLALLIYLILVFLEAFASGFRLRIERVGSGAFFALLISCTLSCVVSLGNQELRTCYVLLPIALPFVADAAAMITGMFLGRHQLTPRLSPKKTVEGAIGGLVGAVVLCILYGLVFHKITEAVPNYYFLAVYGIIGGVVTELGDLAFSYIKRTRKVKDFGGILPGHGGVLDRFDSVIFCAPAVELLVHWLPAFK